MAGGVLNCRHYGGKGGKAAIQFSRGVSVRTEASTRNSTVVPVTELSDDDDDDDGTRRSEQVAVTA